MLLHFSGIRHEMSILAIKIGTWCLEHLKKRYEKLKIYRKRHRISTFDRKLPHESCGKTCGEC